MKEVEILKGKYFLIPVHRTLWLGQHPGLFVGSGQFFSAGM